MMRSRSEMARGNERDRGTRRMQRDPGRRTRKKPCMFCKDHIDWIDYKDANLLRRFMSERGKIRSRRVTGNCTQHQRDIAIAIKTARELALLPYMQRVVNEKVGQRERGGTRDSARGPAYGLSDGEGLASGLSPETSPAEAAALAELADEVLEEVRVGELTADELGPLTPPTSQVDETGEPS